MLPQKMVQTGRGNNGIILVVWQPLSEMCDKWLKIVVLRC